MQRVCSLGIKVVTSLLPQASSLFSLWAKPSQLQNSNSNGSCASELLAPTQHSSLFQEEV